MSSRDVVNQPGRGLSAASGIVAAATSISVATLVATTNSAMRSPIIDVGDRFISITPAWLKDLAISLFDTNDKVALLVGIGLFLTLLAAGVGLLAMRRRLSLGVAGVALLGAVGTATALGSGRGWLAVVPSVVGTISGILLLSWLHRLWYAPNQDLVTGPTRRRLLKGIGGAAVGVGLISISGVALGRRATPQVTGTLPGVAAPLSPVPSGVSLDAPGLSSFVTSNADFYRIDTALSIPRISTDDYRLRIHGMVDRELNLTFADLASRPQVEADITLTCVSNEVGGKLVGNARWQGIRLADLLDEAGVASGADQIVGRSYDDYTCGFPVTALDDGREALVAIGMNGEPLPLEHGFPVRLVVPGLYGYVSATKWLAEIELTTFDAFDQYWVPRGWANQAPIKTSSRIDTPGPFQKVPVGPAAIAGVAWAQTRGIEKVEVQVDGGDWQEAQLADELNDTTWRQWVLPWEATPGNHTISVRATDSTGELQTEERAAPMPDGSTGWHTVVAMGVAA